MSGEGAARQIATLQRQVANLARRVTILEKKITEPPPPDDPVAPPFHHSSTLTVTESGDWPVYHGGNLVRVIATLGTAGSSTTTAELRKNGTAVHTVTFASSVTTYDAGAGVEFDDNDLMSVAITAAGTGAADLVVQPVMVFG